MLSEHFGGPVRAFLAPASTVDGLLTNLHAERSIDTASQELLREPARGLRLGRALARSADRVHRPGDPLGDRARAGAAADGDRLQHRRDHRLHAGDRLPLPARDLQPRSRAASCRSRREEVEALDERTLPVYTILVPLYKEPEVIGFLVNSLSKLDYPKTKLDIKILLEADDAETPAAFRELNPPPHFQMVIVPDSQPRTKPKACNYGLLQARGDFVVIYDAEDQPEPDQLKKAIVAFRKALRRGRLPAVPAQLLQPAPDPADALVHERVLDVVRPDAARARRRRRADPARRHLQPLQARRARRVRRLGPVQRHRGRRPRRPPAQARPADRDPRLDHLRGGHRAGQQLDPAALALGQGLHPDLARADAASPAPAARHRPEGLGLLPAHGRRHRARLPAQPGLLAADDGLAA